MRQQFRDILLDRGPWALCLGDQYSGAYSYITPGVYFTNGPAVSGFRHCQHSRVESVASSTVVRSITRLY